TNRNRVYAIVDAKAGGLYRSDDAGETWTLVSNDARIWGRGWYFCKTVVDPKNADTVYVSNTSLYRSTDAGKTWTAIKGAPGGESDYTAPDPLHPEILFGGRVTRCNVVTGEIKDVSPERGLPAGVTARHTWTLPLVFSKADPHALYFSDQFLFKTTNGGESWTQISPDLTREDPGVPPNLNAATASDAPEGKRRGVIYTIAPSPLRAQTIWVGTDDGLIHRTDDDGKTWAAVTPPELTAWSKVVMMDASHFDVSEAYAAIDRHRLEDYEAHIYRTRDG